MASNVYEISMTPFSQAAKRVVKDYTKISVDELANKFCEAIDTGDEEQKDGYFAALLLRFWSKIGKIVVENPSLNLEYSDGYDFITGAIMQACEPENRKWQKNSKVNASQVINQILSTRFVGKAYYDSNLQKNIGRLNEISLDEVIDSENETTVGDLIEDENSMINPFGSKEIVQSLINNDKIVEAIIIDNVLTKDVFKIDQVDIVINGEKYLRNKTSFWPFKLVKELNELDEEYVEQFFNNYSVPRTIFNKAFEDLKNASNNRKYKLIESTRNFLKCNQTSYM